MNLLEQKQEPRAFGWFLAILAIVLAAIFLPPLLSISFAVFVILLVFLISRLDIGLLVLVALFPFLGIIVDLSGVQFLRHVPFINQVDAPLVDIFGIVLFVAWVITLLIKFLSNSPFAKGREPNISPFQKGGSRGILKEFFYWKSFALFFLSAVVSLFNVSSWYFWVSVKYLARPILFFYVIFFVPVISILKQGGEQLLIKVLKTMYWVGIFSALMGVVSFFVVPIVDFPRATPFLLMGLASWGQNHNLLAETLIVTAPIGFLLWRLSSQNQASGNRWLFVGSVLQVIIALLTFARTAWVVLFLQLVLFLLLEFRGRFKYFLSHFGIFLAFFAPLGGYLFWTLGTVAVQGSTMTRLDMVRISWYYFLQHPWLGNGVGTFMPVLSEVKSFVFDYGRVLEVHGIIWKLIFEQGIFGLLAFGLFSTMVLLFIYRAYKQEQARNNQWRLILLVMFIMAAGIFAYEFFDTTYYTSKLWVPVGVAVGAASLSGKVKS